MLTKPPVPYDGLRGLRRDCTTGCGTDGVLHSSNEDLCDPVVLHLAAGLPRLAHLTLPERSFVTEHGVAGLLARAPHLHTLHFPGDAP